MTRHWWNDDDQLLDALHGALNTARAVPRRFVESGKAAYAWHSIDAELAALTYDSRHEPLAAAAIRAEPAPLRAMTFAAPALTIELHVSAEALLGQLVPEQTGRVEQRELDGTVRTAEVDEIGCFTFRPLPSGSFRLRCDTDAGRHVLTGWIAL
jgi:hypothetical protein